MGDRPLVSLSIMQRKSLSSDAATKMWLTWQRPPSSPQPPRLLQPRPPCPHADPAWASDLRDPGGNAPCCRSRSRPRYRPWPRGGRHRPLADVLALERAPKLLDGDDGYPAPVHRDPDAGVREPAGDVTFGELPASVGVEDPGPTMKGESVDDAPTGNWAPMVFDSRHDPRMAGPSVDPSSIGTIVIATTVDWV